MNIAKACWINKRMFPGFMALSILTISLCMNYSYFCDKQRRIKKHNLSLVCN